jgi:cytochrome c2
MELKRTGPALALVAVMTGMMGMMGMMGCDKSGPSEDERKAAAMTGGTPAHGKELIRTYGCVSCHTIPGIDGARGQVGPSLAGIAARNYLAGKLPNQPANMIKWIRQPQEVSPGTAMPELGVTEQDGKDIAAYLYTLKQ